MNPYLCKQPHFLLILLYNTEIVGVCTCMFTYSFQMDKQVASNLECLFFEKRKTFQRGQKSKKVVPSFNPDKGDSHTLKTKHNRRMVSRFKQITETDITTKTVLFSNPSENVFSIFDTKHDRYHCQSQICLFR